ncbi:FG-GAP-like repeat-containing protein [Bacteroidota bacterium]
MKKIIYTISIIFSVVVFFLVFTQNDKTTYGNNLFGNYSKTISLENMKYMPDVMNNINVLEELDNTSNYYTVNLDSFPVFNGYPKHISGSTREGGIFCNMDSDADLEIVYNIDYTVQAWNLDGSNVSGWPKSVSSYPLECAPAFGDIDGDGQGEIVVTNHGLTSGGYIYAFEKNGSNVTGFPINHGYSTRTPVVEDVDNNGTCEIIVNKRETQQVWVYKGDGTVYTGWPQSINHVPASSAAVGDITGDGVPEIVAESYSSLFAWKNNGDTISGFPFTMPNGDVNSYSSPVLADVDNDNIREIAFGTHVLSGGGYVYILKNNGTILPSWPKYVNYWIYDPPAIGYIDGDNIIDLAIGDQVLSMSPVDRVYAWNKNGTVLSGFPIGPINAINAQILLGDIDNDNMTELIIDDNTQLAGQGKYLAYNHDGTPVTGWPIYTNGGSFFNTPCLTDIDRNGILDIIGAGVESSPSYTNVYLWNTGMNYNPNKITIPMFQYNEKHNGVYDEPTIVGIKNQQPIISSDYRLFQNYPNPFNPTTTIKLQITKASNFKLVVYDILGQELEILIDEKLNPGIHEAAFDGSHYSSGIYFYQLITDGFKVTKSMVLLK